MENTAKIVPVMLYTETTPNPNTLKFVVNRPLLPYDFAEILSKEEAIEAPLAKFIFDIEHVTAVYISNNFVSVTKDDNIEWHELMLEIKNSLKQYLDNNQPILTKNFVKSIRTASNKIKNTDSEVEIKIKTVLDKYVKPAVEMDGGNISFVKFESGILTLQLQGSCSGCPSATVTLKNGIENMMKKFISEVQEVVAENS
jgi:Fe-S cluster biogenesis protein NfuA